MTKQAAIKSYEKSNRQAKVRLEVEKMRMNMNEVKELEFYIERDEMAIKALEHEPRWIPVSERLPNHDEYIKNNGLFNVSDGNRSYFGWFDIYDTKKFVKPTIAGFRVDNAVTAWMPLPKSYKAESEE